MGGAQRPGGHMTIKPGVSLTGLRTETLAGLMIADQVFADLSEQLTITSCTDGNHSRGSLHYVGLAFDARTRNLTNTPDAVASRLRGSLGGEFDVVLESDHIHVEFQPKENRK